MIKMRIFRFFFISSNSLTYVFEIKCLKKQEVKLQKADKFTSMFTYIYLEKKFIRMKFRYIVCYVMIELVGELVSFA